AQLLSITSATGSIALTGGTWTLVNSEEWLPGPAPANFGFQADSMNVLIGSMTGAVRNGVMTPSAASATTTPMPNGFEFPADGLVLTGQGGTVDLDGQPETSLLGALAGLQVPLAGVTSSQTIPPVPAGTYTNVAGVETLTLPVHVLFADFVPTSDVEWQLDGTVVAVRGVPEPTSLALLALSGAAVLARRRV
ncbi:MAG TPA: PEP-CTERM sorting domain-containing protein, partial [Phycisphaerae bacterium]|nr:PEP-CTERM sorting domain-containing protein [Phycisphaerae bacterium]